MQLSIETFLSSIVYFIFTMMIFFFYRKWINGKSFPENIRADGKVIIITGANTGLGKETAIELAKRGAKIIMACRSKERAENARKDIIVASGNENVHFLELDLASFVSIREFVRNFTAHESRLDVLINNAGVMGINRTLSKDGLELHMAVNHYGHFMLTILLLDFLKASRPSRIVNVSNTGHLYTSLKRDDMNSERSYHRFLEYLRSKLANVLFTRELAKYLKQTGVTVNAVHPGIFFSDLSRNLGGASILLSKSICDIFSRIFLKDTNAGAQNTLYAALDFNLQNISGIYLDNFQITRPNRDAEDPELAKWLFNYSEEVTGVRLKI